MLFHSNIPVYNYNILYTSTHLSAGFGRNLKRGLKGSLLRGGQDGAWAFEP